MKIPIHRGTSGSAATSSSSSATSASSSATSSSSAKTAARVREDMKFMYYPDIEEPEFPENIYRKKEFYRSKVPENFADTDIKELCGLKIGLWPYQEFLRNFISTETPYNGALIFHGVGTGKTCASISVAEGLRPYIEAAKKNIFVIAPKHVITNFKDTLYSFKREADEERFNLDPGSLQCTGLSYYLPPMGEDRERARRAAIKSRITSVYKFFGIGTQFPNYVEDLKVNAGIDIAKFFSDSLFIIDEAHRVITSEGLGKEQPDDIFAEGIEKGKRKKTRFAKKKVGAPDSEEESDEESDIEGEEGAGTTDKEVASPKLLQVLKQIFQTAKNTKVIMLSATPIHDDVEEIVEIINLLRINDKKKELIEPKKLFRDLDNPTLPVDQKIDKDYFLRLTKGYISFVRGENPVSFPEVLTPPNGFTPRPLIDITGDHEIYPIPYNIDLALVKCNMNANGQYATHQTWIDDNRGKKGSRIYLAVEGRMISTITFPNLIEGGIPLYGNPGFKKVFNRVPTKKSSISSKKDGLSKRPRVITQFEWQGLPNGMQFLLHENIEPYSIKFAKMLDNIMDTNRGITFIYSSFVESGAYSAAMFLEANGFARYQPSGYIFNEKTRKWDEQGAFKRDFNGKFPDPAFPLITFDSYKKNNMPRLYRCYRCCKLDTDPIHLKPTKEDPRPGSSESADPQGYLPHKFEQGVYSLYLQKGSDKSRNEENEIIKDTINKYGKLIKFVVGSKIIGEGVNLYNVRQVHLLDPWHNNTVSYQARGRAIRNCSHKELPVKEPVHGAKMRTVTVYEYCATVPEYFPEQDSYCDKVRKQWLEGNNSLLYANISFKNANGTLTQFDYSPVPLLTQTFDEMVYQRAFDKDMLIKYLERLMKINAVDCNLFKPLNVFLKTDKDYTRRCDYMKCDYDCVWSPDKKAEKEPGYINDDTYNLFFSKVQVDRAIQNIREIFKRYPALQIEDIIELVGRVEKNLDDEYIYQAMDQILGDPPGRMPMQLTDKMGRPGKIIYRGDAYIFQPNDVPDVRAPIRYRVKPLQVKPRVSDKAAVEFKVEVSDKSEIRSKEAEAESHKKTAENTLNNFIASINKDPSIPVMRPYELEKTLDRLNPSELSYLFQKLFLAYDVGKGLDQLKGAIIEYLAKRYMLLIKPISIRNINAQIADANKNLGLINSNSQSSLKRDPAEFTKSAPLYSIMGHRIGRYEKILVNKTADKHVLSFTPTDISDTDVRDWVDKMQSLATDNDLSMVAYGFYDSEKGDEDSFKVSFTEEEEITANSKTNTISQRSIAKGKVLKTYHKNPLVRLFNSLNILLSDEGQFEYSDIDPQNYAIKDLTIFIEGQLRLLDFATAEAHAALPPEQQKTPRIKYLLYPGQQKDTRWPEVPAKNGPTCREFGTVVLGGKTKGLHRSMLASAARGNPDPANFVPKMNIDVCEPQIGF